jgi:hypothetical protein
MTMHGDDRDRFANPGFIPPPVGALPPLTLRPVRYSALRDPLSYLISLAVAIVCFGLIPLPLDPRKDDAYNMGRISGNFVGHFIFFAVVTLLVSKVASVLGVKSKKWRRVVYATVSIGLVVVLILQDRNRRQRTAEFANSWQQLTNEIRTQIGQPSSNQPILSPPAQLSAQEADESKLLMTLLKGVFDDARASKKRYDQQVHAIIGDGILHPANMENMQAITMGRVKLSQLEQAVNDHEKEVVAIFDGVPDRFNAIAIDQSVKQSAIAGFHETGDANLKLVRQMAVLDRQFVTDSRALLDFMESRMGQFQVVQGKILFSADDDLQQFKTLAHNIDSVVAQEGQVAKQAEAQTLKSVDQMDHTFSGQ